MQHRRGFVRLRHLPAPGGESAGTEEEAHLGLRGSVTAVAPGPEEVAGEELRMFPGAPGSLRERAPRPGGFRAWKNWNVPP